MTCRRSEKYIYRRPDSQRVIFISYQRYLHHKISLIHVLGMSLRLTSARTSRTRKPKSKPPLVSSRSYNRHNRSSRGAASESKVNTDEVEDEEEATERLMDTGTVVAFMPSRSFDDVAAAIQYIRSTMFDEIPDRATGMNSTRIAKTLNFRASLPPLVPTRYVHMLLNAPSKTERDIAKLIKDGIVCRVSVPRRLGGGRVSDGEMLIMFGDWQDKISRAPNLPEETRSKRFVR